MNIFVTLSFPQLLLPRIFSVGTICEKLVGTIQCFGDKQRCLGTRFLSVLPQHVFTYIIGRYIELISCNCGKQDSGYKLERSAHCFGANEFSVNEVH